MRNPNKEPKRIVPLSPQELFAVKVDLAVAGTAQRVASRELREMLNAIEITAAALRADLNPIDS